MLFSPATIVEDNNIGNGGFMGNTSLNLDFLGNSISTGAIEPEPVPKKRKPGRPPKKKDEVETKTTSNGDVIVVGTADDTQIESKSSSLPIIYSNESFSDGYELSNNILKNTVGQLDELGFQVMEEFNKVKNSQMKSKYVVMPQLASTLSTIIGTKVTAVREINKTIKDCYDLEMKRAKENKEQMDQMSDDEKVMNYYNAYISAPVGAQPMIMPPTMIDTTMMMNPNSGIIRASIGDTQSEYDQYMDSMTPAQQMIRYENDPNIKTVVVYDASNPLNRYFDVIDMRTGQSVPNADKPDMMFMEDVTIDEYNGIARNSNLDINYPLIVINKDNKLSTY